MNGKLLSLMVNSLINGKELLTVNSFIYGKCFYER